MSILDKLRGSRSKAKEQAEHVVEQHGDKIATGIEKTGEVASKVTGHRFDDKIDKGVTKAKEPFENGAEADTGEATPSTDSPTAEAPPTTEPPSTEPGSDQDKGPTA